MQALQELCRAMSAEDEVRVAVDQAGCDPAGAEAGDAVGEGFRRGGEIGGRADPHDAVALGRKRTVANGPNGIGASGHGREVRFDPELIPGSHRWLVGRR